MKPKVAIFVKLCKEDMKKSHEDKPFLGPIGCFSFWVKEEKPDIRELHDAIMYLKKHCNPIDLIRILEAHLPEFGGTLQFIEFSTNKRNEFFEKKPVYFNN